MVQFKVLKNASIFKKFILMKLESSKETAKVTQWNVPAKQPNTTTTQYFMQRVQ